MRHRSSSGGPFLTAGAPETHRQPRRPSQSVLDRVGTREHTQVAASPRMPSGWPNMGRQMVLLGIFVAGLSIATALLALVWAKSISNFASLSLAFMLMVGLVGGVSWVIHRKSRRNMRRREDQLRTLLERGSGGALWTWHVTSGLWLGPSWEHLFKVRSGRHSDPAIWFERIHPEDLGSLVHAIQGLFSGRATHLRHRYRMSLPHGELRWVEIYAVPGRTRRTLLGSIRDVTLEYDNERRLIHTAYHDALTSLPNRSRFMAQLEHAFTRAQLNPHYRFALLYLDVDDFKRVNDSLGHQAGDAILSVVGTRLSRLIGERGMVARLGGDEFTVLLTHCKSAQEAEEIATRLREGLKDNLEVGGHWTQLSVTVGIVFYTGEHDAPSDVLRDADTALYEAKRIGQGGQRLFDGEMRRRVLRRLQIESELRIALENRTIEAFFQPIVCLQTGKVEGYEALARLRASDGTWISPVEFIPMVESLGLSERLLKLMLEKASEALVAWKAHGIEPYISVNVSGHALNSALPGHFAAVVSQYGIQASQLKAELTESVLLAPQDNTAQILSELHELGVGLYLDDFGTGYSSLSYLHQLPAERIKLDRSFVASLDSAKTPAIIGTIITLARRLETKVIAEGVETPQQVKALVRLGCESAQGYLFAHPAPLKAIQHDPDTFKGILAKSLLEIES